MTIEELKNTNLLDKKMNYSVLVRNEAGKERILGTYLIQNIPEWYNNFEIEIGADLYGIYIIIKENVKEELLLKDIVKIFDRNTKIHIKTDTTDKLNIEYVDMLKYLDKEVLKRVVIEKVKVQNDFLTIRLKGE